MSEWGKDPQLLGEVGVGPGSKKPWFSNHWSNWLSRSSLTTSGSVDKRHIFSSLVTWTLGGGNPARCFGVPLLILLPVPFG